MCPHHRSRHRVAFAVAAGILVILGGCRPAPATTPPSPQPATTTESLPAAADGTDLQACADGQCEVRTGPGAEIPVPSQSGVDALRVQSVGTDTVTLTGRDLGDSSGGSCSGNCDSSGSNGGFQLTLGPGGEGSENNLDVILAGADGHSAVLRLSLIG